MDLYGAETTTDGATTMVMKRRGSLAAVLSRGPSGIGSLSGANITELGRMDRSVYGDADRLASDSAVVCTDWPQSAA
jgi:hypothetical protein